MDENKEIELEKDDDEEEAVIAANQSDKKKKFFNDVLDVIESTMVTIFAIVLIFTYFLHPVNVIGESMEPTLSTGDKILMTTVFLDLDYGDIVIVDNNCSYDLTKSGKLERVDIDGSSLKECIIKRVIAKGGQTIDIRDEKVFVDGKEIDEPYIANGAKTKQMDAFWGNYPVKVPEGYYFVMGDNREHSSDSRDRRVGLIKKEQIYGKALVRYQPIKDFKFLGNSVNG